MEPEHAPGSPVAAARADEAAADEARARFRREGLRTLPPDEHIAPLLDPDERLVARRHDVLLERREPDPGGRLTRGLGGELYVTSQRLLLVGRLTLSVGLDAIEDAIVSGERLLLVLREGRGVALQVAQPRLLWAEIASARAWTRSAQPSEATAGSTAAAR